MPVRLEKDDDDNTSYNNSSEDSGNDNSSSGGGLFSIFGMIFRALFGWFFSRRG